MAGPDLMCVGSSDSSQNVLKVVDLNIKYYKTYLQKCLIFEEVRKRSNL